MDGPKVLFQETESQRNLLMSSLLYSRAFNKPVSLHPPEYVPITILGDENKAIRAKAVNMISKIRRIEEKEPQHKSSLREFHILHSSSSLKNIKNEYQQCTSNIALCQILCKFNYVRGRDTPRGQGLNDVQFQKKFAFSIILA